MLTDGRTDGRTHGWTDGRTDDGRKVITIAHPEQSSGELKIDFQDGSHGQTILTIFDIHHPDYGQYFEPSFQSTGLLVQEKKFKTDFKMVPVAAILDF